MGTIKPHEIRMKLTNTLGDSIIVENPEEIGEGKTWEVSEKELIEIQQVAEQVAHLRGEVLTKAVNLDEDLDEIIKLALFGKRITESSKLFENLILKTDFFSSMNKLKVFRELVKQHDKLKENDYSSLRGQIHELINFRNKFAHGIIIFRGKRAFLSYYQGGRKEDELTKEYFEKIFESFKKTIPELAKVISSLMNEKS